MSISSFPIFTQEKLNPFYSKDDTIEDMLFLIVVYNLNVK
jgi:hypothetical protein